MGQHSASRDVSRLNSREASCEPVDESTLQCGCGNAFMEDARFCRKCGAKRRGVKHQRSKASADGNDEDEGAPRRHRRAARAPSVERSADQRGGRRRRHPRSEGDEVIAPVAAASELLERAAGATGGAEIPGAAEAPGSSTLAEAETLADAVDKASPPHLGNVIAEADRDLTPQVPIAEQSSKDAGAREPPKGGGGIEATSGCEGQASDVAAATGPEVLEQSPVSQAAVREGPDSIADPVEGGDDASSAGVAAEAPAETPKAANADAEQPAELASTALAEPPSQDPAEANASLPETQSTDTPAVGEPDQAPRAGAPAPASSVESASAEASSTEAPSTEVPSTEAPA